MFSGRSGLSRTAWMRQRSNAASLRFACVLEVLETAESILQSSSLLEPTWLSFHISSTPYFIPFFPRNTRITSDGKPRLRLMNWMWFSRVNGPIPGNLFTSQRKPKCPFMTSGLNSTASIGFSRYDGPVGLCRGMYCLCVAMVELLSLYLSRTTAVDRITSAL